MPNLGNFLWSMKYNSQVLAFWKRPTKYERHPLSCELRSSTVIMKPLRYNKGMCTIELFETSTMLYKDACSISLMISNHELTLSLSIIECKFLHLPIASSCWNHKGCGVVVAAMGDVVEYPICQVESILSICNNCGH